MKLPKKVKMSEARYNDLVYLTLKTFFVEPIYGGSPRECDIRVCMLMGNPAMRQTAGTEARTLTRTEFTHETAAARQEYWIEPAVVLEAVLRYLEEHWMKERFPAKARREMNRQYRKIAQAVMATPEHECAITYKTEE
jgi:hypothetical protein